VNTGFQSFCSRQHLNRQPPPRLFQLIRGRSLQVLVLGSVSAQAVCSSGTIRLGSGLYPISVLVACPRFPQRPQKALSGAPEEGSQEIRCDFHNQLPAVTFFLRLREARGASSRRSGGWTAATSECHGAASPPRRRRFSGPLGLDHKWGGARRSETWMRFWADAVEARGGRERILARCSAPEQAVHGPALPREEISFLRNRTGPEVLRPAGQISAGSLS
jgi:hypothetical protein